MKRRKRRWSNNRTHGSLNYINLSGKSSIVKTQKFVPRNGPLGIVMKLRKNKDKEQTEPTRKLKKRGKWGQKKMSLCPIQLSSSSRHMGFQGPLLVQLNNWDMS